MNLAQELERMLGCLPTGVSATRWHFPSYLFNTYNNTTVLGLPVCCCEPGDFIALEAGSLTIKGTYPRISDMLTCEVLMKISTSNLTPHADPDPGF